LSDEEAREFAMTIARAADDRKAADITVLKMAEVSYLADYFVIVTGFSNVQVRAIARAIENAVATQWHRQPIRTEGVTDGRWILQDYGEVIVHIFLPKEREFYDLEAFWGHAQPVEFIPEAASA
jgi:ribosome-associated protein